MYRLTCLLFVTAAACGTDMDSGPGTGTAEDLRPDAGAPRGDAGAPDARDACAEAKLHSDFAWIQEHVLTPSCATAMCHSGESPSVDLSLEAGVAYANLVNKGSSTQTGWRRVVPGSTNESYLMVALNRAPGPMPENGYMPLGRPALCSEKLDAIARWITAGAAM